MTAAFIDDAVVFFEIPDIEIGEGGAVLSGG